ncbi:hypothetical protein GCM10011583_49140 [Streptomyces camponoticapitis]|uniref:Methyltransferase type 12 domain-containing protein n=1 Tax=Streptomyces camponoticapitis TaxID=1616125 RepID=A0ABQ2EIW7_9ACTN|nr:class I SAM-dependent methyltransferase [Streptomyces camponoticapitis]GGK11194.1 hypothetical protein GCM10011583_49140 [Streptomyces camponoticapitis]
MERRDVRGHYEDLAAEYDEHWVYGPDYVPWMSARIMEALRLSSKDRIADVGCGTGLFAREVARSVQPRHPILCVDPSEAMLRQIGTPAPEGLTKVVGSAEDIAEGRVGLPYERLDALWLKESVHHLAEAGRTLRSLAARLAAGGRILVVMLPATIRYPLFQDALTRFEELQPDPEIILRHLRAAELDVELTHVEHELRVKRDTYFRMVRSRYMSLLSTFSDRELDKGIDEMREAHPEPVLVFPDRFAFITGVRRGEG